MAILLFKLKYVPDEEAQDIRDLLHENEIDFYETSAGILGFSMPAIWLKNEAQAEKAGLLINEYQQQLQSQVREEYQLQQRTVMDMFRENPAHYFSYILAILFIGYFMIYLFFNLL